MKIVNWDPWTQESTKNENNEDVFVFMQHGIKYRFLKNSLIKLRKINKRAQTFTNPYLTGDDAVVSNNTFKRIQMLANERNASSNSNNTSTQNNRLIEENLMEGIRLMYNESKNANATYLIIANEYIRNMKELLNDSEINALQKAKNRLVKAKRI